MDYTIVELELHVFESRVIGALVARAPRKYVIGANFWQIASGRALEERSRYSSLQDSSSTKYWQSNFSPISQLRHHPASSHPDPQRSMADSTPKSYHTDPTLYLYTSLTSGSSHIITATSRLETILKANKIQFQALDVATDEKARMMWGRRAGKRKLPGLVRMGMIVAVGHPWSREGAGLFSA